MSQTERDEDEIRADLFFLPFILYHPYFILALTATTTRYAVEDGPHSFLFLGLVSKFSHRYLMPRTVLSKESKKATAVQWRVIFFRHLIVCFYYKDNLGRSPWEEELFPFCNM